MAESAALSHQLVQQHPTPLDTTSPHPSDQLEFDLHNIQCTPRPDQQNLIRSANMLPTPPRSTTKSGYAALDASSEDLLPVQRIQDDDMTPPRTILRVFLVSWLIS